MWAIFLSGHVVRRRQETPLPLCGGASGGHGVADVGVLPLMPGWGHSGIPIQSEIQPRHCG